MKHGICDSGPSVSNIPAEPGSGGECVRDGVAVNSLGKNRGPTQRRAFDGGSGVKVKLADEPGGKGNKRPQRGDQPPTRRGEGIRPRVSGDVSGQGTDSGGSKETTDIPKTGQEMAPAPWASKHTHRMLYVYRLLTS